MAYRQKPPTFMRSCLKQKTYPKSYTKKDIRFLKKQREDIVRYEDLDEKGKEIWKKQGKQVPKGKTAKPPLKQKVESYWYKINGKNVTKEEYNKYQNEPGKMEGGGKTTSDPDPSGRKAATEKARSKNKRPTVLTEAQTKALEKKPPFKATRGYSMLMSGAGSGKFNEDGKLIGAGSNYYTSGDLSYRGEFDTDLMFKPEPIKEENEDEIDDKSDDSLEDDGNDKKNNSLNFSWPKIFKPNTSRREKDYNTTACPDFSKGTNPSDPSGFGDRRRRRGPFWAK